MHIWVESGTLLKYPMPFLILFPLTSSLLWATDICAWVYVHLMFDLLFCYYNYEMEVRRDRYMYIYVDIEKRRETVRGRARYREKQWQLRVQRYLVPDGDFENVSSSTTQSFYWIVLKPLLHLSDKFHFTFSNLWSNNCYLQFYKSYHAHVIIFRWMAADDVTLILTLFEGFHQTSGSECGRKGQLQGVLRPHSAALQGLIGGIRPATKPTLRFNLFRYVHV